MSTDRDPATNSPKALQLLLFLDERSASRVINQEIRDKLSKLNSQHPFELQIIDVTKQPDLAEHYRVIATPALIKLYPKPRQILAGSNLREQIDNWWERWQEELIYEDSDLPSNYGESLDEEIVTNDRVLLSDSIGYVTKLIKLSDEIFTLKQEKAELLDRLNCKIEQSRYWLTICATRSRQPHLH